MKVLILDGSFDLQLEDSPILIQMAQLENKTIPPLPPLKTQPGELAYVLYTSGSTGRPKGVAMEHGAVANTIMDINRRYNLDSRDRIFGVSSLSFDLSVWDIYGSLAAGATLVLPEPKEPRVQSESPEVPSKLLL